MRFGWREAILLVAGFACWRTLQRSFFRPSLGAAVSPLGRDRPQPSASNASAPLQGVRAEFAERPEATVLVALNKKVYRFVDERNYSCPAMRGAPCMFTTLPTKFGRADAIIDVLKDPRKVRPLGWRSVQGQLPRESATLPPSRMEIGATSIVAGTAMEPVATTVVTLPLPPDRDGRR